MSKKLIPMLNTEKLTANLVKLRRYSFAIFIILVASVYAFILIRINSLGSVEPSDESVNSQVSAAHLVIDKSVVNQLKSLKDNSVNVQSLFDGARKSPFQEKN
jgi:hypothetical protein